MENKSKKKKKIELWAQIAVFIVVTAGIIIFALMKDGPTPPSTSTSGVVEGQAAPDFTFPGLDGVDVRLSDYKGKAVLVNVWATWCKPCVDEMPSMEELYQKFKDKNFEILAISIDENGRAMVAEFVRRHKLTFPVLLDSKGMIKSLYGVTAVPESFILDEKGMVVKKIIGQANWTAPAALDFFRSLVKP